MGRETNRRTRPLRRIGGSFTQHLIVHPTVFKVDGGFLADAVRGEASARFEQLSNVHEAHFSARHAALALDLGSELIDEIRRQHAIDGKGAPVRRVADAVAHEELECFTTIETWLGGGDGLETNRRTPPLRRRRPRCRHGLRHQFVFLFQDMLDCRKSAECRNLEDLPVRRCSCARF